MSNRRPGVTVVCPFAGSLQEARETIRRLTRIERQQGDELLVVDNSRGQVLATSAEAPEPGVRVVPARQQQSSYYARNVGAEAAASDWLLFIDSDCVPSPSLLDDYVSEPVADDTGALAGAVVGLARQRGFLAEYARARGVLDQRRAVAGAGAPAAATANLLVRRAAWEDVGGFCEGIRSGGDFDFCWRLQDAGWKLAYRPSAYVEHVHRDRLAALLRQFVRYGAGRAWLRRRHPGSVRPRSHARLLIAAPVLVPALLLTGRPRHAAYRFVDVMLVLANHAGRLMGNRARSVERRRDASAHVALVTDVFPEAATLERVRLLTARGVGVWIEAEGRPSRPQAEATRRLDVAYLEDDGTLRRLVDLAWLIARHPVRSLRERLLAGERLGSWRDAAPRARRLAAMHVVEVHSSSEAAARRGRRVARFVDVPCASVPGT